MKLVAFDKKTGAVMYKGRLDSVEDAKEVLANYEGTCIIELRNYDYEG